MLSCSNVAMNQASLFGQFDPSKMDPKIMMQLSTLIQELPPDRLLRLQTLMHNMMAGFDVKSELAEFENTLPPGFREKMTSALMGFEAKTNTSQTPDISISSTLNNPNTSESISEPTTVRGARLTILGAISRGELGVIEGYEALFTEESSSGSSN